MKRIFSNPLSALIVGLCLRLFFVLKFPANSGDTILYEQMATNWLKHHVYAMDVNGAIQPVDLRMPGYPAYLALVYWLTGRTGAAAHLWVMLGQVVVDLVSCLVIALLAPVLVTLTAGSADHPGRAFKIALWLAVLCPFTANYVAVPLTEVFAVFLTGVALLFFFLLLHLYMAALGIRIPFKQQRLAAFAGRNAIWLLVSAPGLLVGLATLFRPESPILLIAGLIVLAFVIAHEAGFRASLQIAVLNACMCVLPLVPWAARNFVTLHEVQFLAPKNSNLPGELVPSGFMAWEKTWLFRMKDCYLAPWKLNGEAIDVDQLPARAFDSEEEKQRVATILEKYNEDLTLTAEEDAAFAQLARERTARHPLRTYLRLPLLRAATMWFTPRIELLPLSGTVFPLRQSWEDDKVDQSATIGLFLLNIFYVGLGVWGAAKLWHGSAASRAPVLLILLFILLRTAFLTTLETPEPRYVLECFPALIALGAVALAEKRYNRQPEPSSS